LRAGLAGVGYLRALVAHRTSFVVTLQAVDRTAEISIRYDSFGSPVTVARPAEGDVRPAPDALYGRLGM
jgi:hypothetical protein